MRVVSKSPGVRLLLVALTVSASGAGFAQQQDAPDTSIVVNGVKSPGPEIKGVITARNEDKVKVVTADGASTIIAVNDATQVRAGGGLFGVHSKLAQDALLNGLPVTVKTWRAGDGQAGSELVASRISFRNSDLKTATMIRNGTSQRFEEQTAATENLRGRLGDIDKYNVKGTTEVHFDTGKATLSAEDKAQLCNTASTAQANENALLLVVGYTDSTGGDDLNQELSEKRAGRVINYLQQACGWKPYRMLTPTGMAKADPAAPNDTPEGKAMNRRVAVNILVSKSVDGI
ncbi:MAG TPA: OmpA family protein [Sphingomonas sp.]|uniref:OmpA family protein n=1 Tax=Sphingomonas sp. TaxID=28214 RepID=UPI002CF4151C|nr:OmpA family protein [Sphingomonas sp.]HMI18810.1 OmpA family protein [Sphingomonas sp.]